ncbi:hypothetical protein ASG01_00670 [Chryseobacterium sp. Leaf180]|uniref:McrC family protein n=1 Tax=Chryseobacterium sp. Leaf180 TaxID=1736289 RepID=UPI0006FFED71|nr:hypothetical protein [Chryseobacterium sp. Leaf180]KQR94435.1 hypothetical protein ASG01_00670 [Chryseobacterium sp. Leaf180]
MRSIQVYEHSFLAVGESGFEKGHFVALSKLNDIHGFQYFDLKHNGVVFKQYVGVIQVEGLTIEILPKIDVHESEDRKGIWQMVLIEMLRVTRKLQVQQVGQANVSRQSIHLLDIYFEWFLNEVQLLIHQGLIKQYYKETGNVKALKGKLEFAGHIQKNLVHKERFYTTHQEYDKDHLLHQILGQALEIIATLSKGNYLFSRCKTVQLNFPEVKKINANENAFTKIPKLRKTAPYETALAIARLIILNYAPNISSGSEKMLALLFDMNSLWEQCVLIRLQQAAEQFNVEVTGQEKKTFWETNSIRPDIVIKQDSKVKLIIDTKWKNIDYSAPSTHDLRQMYVYNRYWSSSHSLLLYPAKESGIAKDQYKNFVAIENEENHCCMLGKVSVLNADDLLNENLGYDILESVL